jgi:hypothetical protein
LLQREAFNPLRRWVPTQTTSGFDGATATSPMHSEPAWSNTGANVMPLFVVLNTPPLAVPT